MKKIIGILGGMGPAATIDAMDKIIKNTPARCDQEHIPVIAVSFPDIPDRTASIISYGESPLKKMLSALHILEAESVQCIIMPCNTAHYWYDELSASTNVYFPNMIEIVCNKIVKEGINNVAILATTGTVKARLYQDKLEKENVKYVIPDELQQYQIMESILAYKGGNDDRAYQLMESVVLQLKRAGVKKFIMGCTEIPIILSRKEDKENYIDTTEALVKVAVDWYCSDQFY